MQTNQSNNFIKRAFSSAVTITLLLSTLATGSTLARADEFTVGHTGADVAFNNGLDGSGITVAVIDSGAFKVPDLATKVNGTLVTRINAYINFVPDGKGPVDPVGHGTHVAGCIAEDGQSSSGPGYYRTFYGIARNANLAIIRVLDENGEAPVSRVIKGIEWAIDNKDKYNIRVINLSLGHPVGESYTTDPLCQAVEAAWKAGIVVVCAAGNNGRLNSSSADDQDNEGFGTAYGSIQSPGNDPYVITVGAIKQDLSTAAVGTDTGNRCYDRIATYSSRGPSRLDLILKPDLVAPGNQIISTDVGGNYGSLLHTPANMIPFNAYQRTTNTNLSHAYFQLSGTSMAAPVVAGAAALMLQANPNLTPDTVKARLMVSADKWADPLSGYDPCTYGAGYVNIPAALNCTVIATQPAASPPLVRDAKGNVSISSVLWGSNVIWGSNINSLNVIWGNNVIWGTNVIWGSNVIWGQSVWTDNVVWGEDTSAVDFSFTAINGE